MLNLDDLLTRAKSLKIAVIGDLIQDVYLYGDVERISPEAPIPVVKYTHTTTTMGGAGNVFMNIYNLVPETDLYCFHTGPAFWGPEVHDRIFVHNFPSAKKTRIMSGQHHMLRVDEELAGNEMEWTPFRNISWWKTFEQNLFDKRYDAIVLSDYGKGVLGDSVIQGVIELALHYNMPVIVDAKKDFYRFEKATIVKCNGKEWDNYVPPYTTVADGYWGSGTEYCDRNGVDNLVVTIGSRGMFCYDKLLNKHFDPTSTTIVDVCGAGDTVTAILAIMRALGQTIEDSCKLANLAAAEVCKYPGVTPITEEMLLNAFDRQQW